MALLTGTGAETLITEDLLIFGADAISLQVKKQTTVLFLNTEAEYMG